ncbi:efflux transporter outer membrane subunit [Pigmentiphaga aceris]|nr:efflux transporter outer membrane subunit [Pigmentiphaga aceris]
MSTGKGCARRIQAMLLSAGLSAALLAGCAVDPKPAPPTTVAVPADWRTHIGPVSPVEQAWWQSFNDPALNALVRQALDNNTDLRTAASRIAEYEARLRVAQAAHAPSFNASAGPVRSRARGSTGRIAETTLFQIGAQASYEVDISGRLDKLEAAAIADLQGQRYATDAAALSVASNVASGYLNLRGLDAQLAVAKATLASRTESLNRAKHLYDTGYNSRLEWLQSESEYRAAAGAVPQLERTIAQQENALSLLVGANPGPIARGQGLDGLTPPPLVSALPSELLRRRPDIAQAEQRIVSTDATYAAARDQLLPSVQLSTSLTLQGLTLGKLIDAPTVLWSLGGSVLAPVFQGDRLRAQADVTAALRDQTVIAYDQVVLTAFAEVENALSGIDLLREQITEAQARRDAAREALRIAQNRYRNGYASYLDQLDAQRSSYTAEQTLVQLQAALLTVHVDLYRALGGGWQSSGS